MNNNNLENQVNACLKSNEYEQIWCLLSADKEDRYQDWSKERKTMFWLSFLERKSYSEEGKHGILGNSKSLDEALKTFDSLKKLLQRLEWWPEFDPGILRNFCFSHSVSRKELLWIMDAYTLDSQYALDRYNGKCQARDLFFRSENEISKMCQRHSHYLDMRNGQAQAICFITCCNNEYEYQEMLSWIERLWIPEEISVETIKINAATSMCSGYNEAMRACNAKYKVYLHQDIRILNPFFIFDIIDTFQRNPGSGMIGMMGSETIPDSGIMWQSKRYGAVVHSEFNADSIAETIHECSLYDSGDFSAVLVDGFLIATCIDIPWREDLFKGWDFYDASQSQEYIKKGYSIIVPPQEVAWCLHDFGQINWSEYDNSRQIFVNEYSKIK